MGRRGQIGGHEIRRFSLQAPRRISHLANQAGPSDPTAVFHRTKLSTHHGCRQVVYRRFPGRGPWSRVIYVDVGCRARNTANDSKVDPAEKAYILGQITELLTNYGTIPIFMFDGYSWAMGHWAVPWQAIYDTIKALQPNCLIAETNAMHEPWESDLLFIEEPLDNGWCPAGNTYAAIQGQTIDGRNWFWRSGMTLLTVNNIVTTHLKALEPLYCNFQLNCPPNQTGQLDANVVTLLGQVGAAWSPNNARAQLPAQLPMIEQPITPDTAYVTSGSAINLIDDVNDWCRSAGGHYQTLWTSAGALPQSVTLDFGKVYNNLSMLFYLPKRDSENVSVAPSGYITSYKVYVSSDNITFTQITTGKDLNGGTFGTWPANAKIKRISFAAQTARYIKLEADAVSGGTNAIISSIEVGGGRVTTAVNEPVIKRTLQSSGMSVRTAIGRFAFDPAFSGKTKEVAIYDLGGKLVSMKTIKKNSIDLQKDFGIPDGLYVLKVKDIGR